MSVEFHVILRPLPGDVPPEIRLRRWLKGAVRQKDYELGVRYGLQAVDVREINGSHPAGPTEKDTPAPAGQMKGNA